jgi:DNA-binding NarL/FixJ family response regulator
MTTLPVEPAHVIIADDHDLARAGIRSLLSGERGIAVVGEAKTGTAALALCRQLHPDLVLLDVRMPDLDGLAVTRAIRTESPATRVILVTMYHSADYLVEALKAGAAGFLLKGSPKEEIISTVRQVLAGQSVLDASLVLDQLRQLSPEAKATRNLGNITLRERDVLRLIALGQSNKAIADTLSLTISTVKTHVEHVIAKLGASDRTHAVVRAIELGIVRPYDADDTSATH